MRLPDVKVDTDYVKFGGGIDLKTPVLSLPPGAALAAQNYEPDPFGGYTRIDGYERMDGRAAPSSAQYYYATLNSIAALTVGLQVQGATSGASAVVAYISGTAVAFTKVVGTFLNGETLTKGGGGLPILILGLNYTKASAGTLTSTPKLNGAPTGLLDATMQAAAADIYRADIKPPPGSGPTRGVAIYRGIRYAWRDTLDGSACAMWQSSDGGWRPVALGLELAFAGGGTYEVQDGDTIVGNLSGARAVVARVVLESGTFAGGTAAGRFILLAQTGTFQVESLKVGTNPVVALVTGPATQIRLLPGGRYETENHNFFGQTDTLRMYGCDNVNRGFEFDGTVFVPIRTGMTVDVPSHVFIHKEQLFFSFRASSQNSGIGAPYKWTVVSGADEIAMGDDITGYAVQTGDAAAIFARNSTKQLLGSSVDDFVLKTISPKEGAIPYSVQTLSDSYYFDDAGVRTVRPSQAYGNFNNQTLTAAVQPIIDLFRSKVIASAVYRKRGQYRVYGSDGSGIIMGFVSKVSAFGSLFQNLVGITTFQYPISVTCTCSGESEDGEDVVFFGDDQGYVYQGDRGSSFDGQQIEAFLVLPFNNLKTPRIRKRFRKIVQEMSSQAYGEIRFQPIFSYGAADIASHPFTQLAIQGAGGYWDVSNWDQFYWDAPVVSTPEFDVNGTGINLALVYYTKSAIDLGHTLQGALIHYTPRRLSR